MCKYYKLPAPRAKQAFRCHQHTVVRHLSYLLSQAQHHLADSSSPTVSITAQMFGKKLGGKHTRRSISAASFPLGHLHDQGVILPQLQCEGLSQSFLSSAKSKKLNSSGSVEPSKPLSSMDTETSQMIFSDVFPRWSRCSAENPFGGHLGHHQKSSAI